jgi:hypothetical protein
VGERRRRRKTVCAGGACWPAVLGPSTSPLGGLSSVPLPKAFAYFNSPLYVPDQGRYVLKLLETGGPRQFFKELERLSTLGSPWASAVLGYIALIPGPDGKRDTSRAMELCRSHAHAGDSYAQFVLAWALIYSGQTKLAFESIKKATLSSFPPATLDFATFIWNLPGKKASDAAAALKALRFAYRAGHKAAAVWRYDFYRSGRVGLIRRPLGFFLAPLARLRFVLTIYKDPFACRVFVFQHRATGPLLRDEPRLLFFRQWAKNLRNEFQRPATGASALPRLPLRRIVMWGHFAVGLVTLFIYLIGINLAHFPWPSSRAGTALLGIAVLLPYAISAGHCWRMYTWQGSGPRRLRVAAFIALLVSGAAVVNSILLGVFGHVDGLILFELLVVQSGGYLWGAEWVLNVI